MIVLLTCNGYQCLEVLRYDALDLPARCAKWEQHLNDGFAVIAVQHGSIIADAEGYHEMHSNERDYIQPDFECGYLD